MVSYKISVLMGPRGIPVIITMTHTQNDTGVLPEDTARATQGKCYLGPLPGHRTCRPGLAATLTGLPPHYTHV